MRSFPVNGGAKTEVGKYLRHFLNLPRIVVESAVINTATKKTGTKQLFGVFVHVSGDPFSFAL